MESIFSEGQVPISPKPMHGEFYHLVHESRRLLMELLPSLRHVSDDASLLELLPAARKKEWGDKLVLQSCGSKVRSVSYLNQQSLSSVAEIVEGWRWRGGNYLLKFRQIVWYIYPYLLITTFPHISTLKPTLTT